MSAAHNSRAQLSNSASTHIHCFVFFNWDCLLPLVHSFCCCTHPLSPLSLPGLQTFTSDISFIVSSAHLSEKNHKPPPVPGLHAQLPSLNYQKPPLTNLANKATKKQGYQTFIPLVCGTWEGDQRSRKHRKGECVAWCSTHCLYFIH